MDVNDNGTYFTITPHWTRLSVSATSSNTWRFFDIGDPPAGTYYIWGYQLEQGAFPTSYIPTTTTAVTRAADTLSVPAGAWFSGSAGTQLTTQYYTSNFADYSPIIGSAQSNSIGISYQGLSGNNVVGFVDGTIRGSTGILSSSGFYNMAISNTASQILVSRNGAAAVSAAGKNLSGATTLYLSKDFNNTMANAPKWIKKYKFYPSAMDNTQLQLLTQ